MPSLQRFQEFFERRLAPAINTCRTVQQRQESLSARAARANHLLATRVDISHERQNRALLESMNRRAACSCACSRPSRGCRLRR